MLIMSKTIFLSCLSLADYRFFKEFQEKITESTDQIEILIETVRTFLYSGPDKRKEISNGRIGSALSTIKLILESKNYKNKPSEIIIFHDDFDNSDTEGMLSLDSVKKNLGIFISAILKHNNNNSKKNNHKISFVPIPRKHERDLQEIANLMVSKIENLDVYDLIYINHSAGSAVMQGATFNIAMTVQYSNKTKSFIVSKNDDSPSEIHTRPSLPQVTDYGRPESITKNLETLKNSSKFIPYQRICEDLMAYTKSPVTFFFHGESGTGKEMLAIAFANSIRAANGDIPMLSKNCAAIPGELIDSEFFGHKKGAFTGAVTDYDGIFKRANGKDGGILFLDEVCDLSPAAQSKLLRVIQDRTFTPVGADKPIELNNNFFIITASHKNIYEEVAKGNFRADLAHRITTVEITLPSLNYRGLNDILSASLTIYKNQMIQKGKPSEPNEIFTEECYEALSKFNWVGNFRTLEKLITRLTIENVTPAPYNLPAVKRQLDKIQSTFEIIEKYRDKPDSNEIKLFDESRPSRHNEFEKHDVINQHNTQIVIELNSKELTGSSKKGTLTVESNCEAKVYITCSDSEPKLSINNLKQSMEDKLLVKFSEMYERKKLSTMLAFAYNDEKLKAIYKNKI